MSEESPPLYIWRLAGTVKNLSNRIENLETQMKHAFEEIIKLEDRLKEAAK